MLLSNFILLAYFFSPFACFVSYNTLSLIMIINFQKIPKEMNIVKKDSLFPILCDEVKATRNA